jgi:MOSC domain-containing protein YiiM
VTGKVVSINAGPVVPVDWANRLDRTAIDKRPVTGPATVHELGVEGDEQADRRVHGGMNQAIYAYAREDLDWWADRLARPLRDGQFGENLTTWGVDVTGAAIGERWRVGPDVVLEVTAPRIPCKTFQNWMGEPGWIRRFVEAGRPGAYLRVVLGGEVAAGDVIRVLDRPGDVLTIGEAFGARTGLRS